jgi:uncharacterized membrane protein
MPDADITLAVLVLAAVSYACRAGGFLLMRFVRITPRIEAALRAVPLAVMVGIVMPSAASGRVPELAALPAVAIVMKLTGNELAAALVGLAMVAGGRWLGF